MRTGLLQLVRPDLAALAQSLPAGLEHFSWLVSRHAALLSKAGVPESAIESLAENLNGSVVVPIFCFVLPGLSGAAVYRFADTADAWVCRGAYKGGNWERAGKSAARADEVLSWPNSGWPMAAMALGLQVCLKKPQVYSLKAQCKPPLSADTRRAVAYASRVLVIAVTIATAILLPLAKVSTS